MLQRKMSVLNAKLLANEKERKQSEENNKCKHFIVTMLCVCIIIIAPEQLVAKLGYQSDQSLTSKETSEGDFPQVVRAVEDTSSNETDFTQDLADYNFPQTKVETEGETQKVHDPTGICAHCAVGVQVDRIINESNGTVSYLSL